MTAGQWVLDGSAALAWAFPDEQAEAAETFLKGLHDPYLVWVPALFWYEIANALVTAKRRGRISEATESRLSDLFMQLPIRTDAMVMGTAFLRYGTTASNHGLTAYDASYLELACRRNLGLVTFDEKLKDAARTVGVPLWRDGDF